MRGQVTNRPALKPAKEEQTAFKKLELNLASKNAISHLCTQRQALKYHFKYVSVTIVVSAPNQNAVYDQKSKLMASQKKMPNPWIRLTPPGRHPSSLDHPTSVDHEIENPAPLLGIQTANLLRLLLLQTAIALDRLLKDLLFDHDVRLRLDS